MHIVTKQNNIMQYFQAVQIGKKRANKAQMTLFDLAGFAMLTLTTKKKRREIFACWRRDKRCSYSYC